MVTRIISTTGREIWSIGLASLEVFFWPDPEGSSSPLREGRLRSSFSRSIIYIRNFWQN